MVVGVVLVWGPGQFRAGAPAGSVQMANALASTIIFRVLVCQGGSCIEENSLGTVVDGNRIITHGHGVFDGGAPSIQPPGLREGVWPASGSDVADVLIVGAHGSKGVRLDQLLSWATYYDASTTVFTLPRQGYDLSDIASPAHVGAAAVLGGVEPGRQVVGVYKPDTCYEHHCLAAAADGVKVTSAGGAGYFLFYLDDPNFIQGSSGGGVFDARTGALIGNMWRERGLYARIPLPMAGQGDALAGMVR